MAWDESNQSAAGDEGSISSSIVENNKLLASTRTAKVASSSVKSGRKPVSSVTNAACRAETILVKMAAAWGSAPENLPSLPSNNLRWTCFATFMSKCSRCKVRTDAKNVAPAELAAGCAAVGVAGVLACLATTESKIVLNVRRRCAMLAVDLVEATMMKKTTGVE
ncbi:hypothetical protein CYMTET_47410 [Cymbomonas tetramitiformis]|uniref:Uncharacterized protein n=1 Tax=Cymbomonas tetramitiformis TaxID=36881 RepID=A0AAE0BW22_9CHLO|nr:hypothetical protein CYMTET_47410 [Cymbomonas tetramitiformis]